MKTFLSGFLLLFFSYSEAKIAKYIPSGLKQKSWDLKKACEVMGHKNPLLVDGLNLAWIDCMGHRVSARDFCLKVAWQDDKKRSFMRALVNMKKKTVGCSYGHSAVLSVKCDKKHRRYCKNKQTGCEDLKQYFAHGLDTIRAIVNKKKNIQMLNCYYQAKNAVNP